MPPLAPSLRKTLETTVKDGRDLAEDAARIALQRLAVDVSASFPNMTEAQRALRTTLRARARQLGDPLERAESDAAGRLETMPALVAECAYEHWHRLIFARFLAENNLLIHPDAQVPVSLAECDELAPDEGLPDGWAVAEKYAAAMLPRIFRPDDPLLAVSLAPESRHALERKVADLPASVFVADDSLGWVYQFWQIKRKEEVNKSGAKIDGKTISAVTQLFTEHYMVAFLLHNSLGAWWAARHPGQPLPLAEGEADYLRRLDDGTPAAGSFPGWPDRAADLRILDPCGGSGHFMVATLDLLSRIRAQEEHLSEPDAVDAVLRDNLFMLEIDPRCTQIAAFALALAAWRRGGYRPLPAMHVACSGLPVTADAGEWARLVPPQQRFAMRYLHSVFKQAPELGSLIDPTGVSDLGLSSVSFASLQNALSEALTREDVRTDADQQAIGVIAQGLAEAADILAGRYHLVITNVPYLARGKQGDSLRAFGEEQSVPKEKKRYFDARADLATMFVERCCQLCARSGTFALVSPQNWLSLGSYRELRLKLLRTVEWTIVAKLGAGAFQTPMWDFNVMLTICQNLAPERSQALMTIDVSTSHSAAEKAKLLLEARIRASRQADQLTNPDAIITADIVTSQGLLEDYAIGLVGIMTGDAPRFEHVFWEVPHLGTAWEFHQSTADRTTPYGGREGIILWENGCGQLRQFAQQVKERLHDADRRGNQAWGKRGVAINQIGNLSASIYTGNKFDCNVAVVLPKDEQHLAAIWAFCHSPGYVEAIRRISQKVSVTNATLVKVPFDLAHWQTVADAAGPLPEPYSNYPTQWLFKGDIPSSTEPLQVAVARLLGYRWPEQEGHDLTAYGDDDGIVPLPALSGELAAAERLRALLAAAYGNDWSHAREQALLAAVEFGGKSLETWLRDGFFRQHCKLFHNRPFIWHLWDGRRDGFAVLVNYHKLDRRLLEKLIYTYLGDWIVRQQDGQKRGEEGADARLAAALTLQDRLKLILAGEPPYDIYVRWKALHEQPIGWEPDLNDGVRLNIRPFMAEDPRYAKAPSLLRVAPNIKWGVDRGTNPDGSRRDNDVHLTVAAKQAARKPLGI